MSYFQVEVKSGMVGNICRDENREIELGYCQ